MKGISRLFTAALLSCAAVTVHAQTELQSYVLKCQNDLQFAASEVKPMNCNDGPRFAFGGRSPVNDFVVKQRVNQNVDMVAACRWGDGSFGQGNNTKFLSIEMLIHNHANGGTCFFAANDVGSDKVKPVASAIVAVTNFSATHPNANDYWMPPTKMANKFMFTDVGPIGAQDKLVCVRCHSQGPYVASARIAPALANFGLLNDGHHTYSNFAALNHYFVVGSRDHTISDPGSLPLGNWNFLIAQNNQAGGCSSSCHALARTEAEGSFAPIGNLTDPADASTVVLPSISGDISELSSNGMPPDAEDSPYRWINIDQPSSDGAEVETFTASKMKIAVTGYCGAPTWIEANALGTDAPFSNLGIGFMPDKLRSFNLRDGLQCLNSDQPGGKKCADYQVSYKCPTPFEKWVGPFNKDTNYSDDGDHEERFRAWNDARAACGNQDPVAIRADALMSGTIVHSATGPADRLAQFNQSGLVCRNADQGSGQSCSSYAVRYRGCRDPDDAQLVRLKNAWVSPPTFGDRYLTTTNNIDGAETRAQGNNYQYSSQDWIIEHVDGGNVRLYDMWSRKYLTASSTGEQATVLVKNSDGTLTRQLWIMEPIMGSSEVRFRNVGSGKYLTVGNYTSDPYFAPMFSQTLSAQNWASQRWVVQ